MARPVVLSVEDKFRLVVAVISGELTVAEAARPLEGLGAVGRQLEAAVLRGRQAGVGRRRPAEVVTAAQDHPSLSQVA